MIVAERERGPAFPVDPFIVRNLSCPMAVMRFHLVYHGPLPGNGNKPKPDDVRDIRDFLHPQLAMVWETHAALKRLRSTARVARGPGRFLGSLESPFDDEGRAAWPLQEGFVDLREPVSKGDKTYHPLVRESLDLNCSLEIRFPRQENPGQLVLQGGDLDNRIKTLLGFSKQKLKQITCKKLSYCLMEIDTPVSGINVSTDRILFPVTEYPNEAHLVIKVMIRVLKLGTWNVCLMGD